jgi:hypothetical protein
MARSLSAKQVALAAQAGELMFAVPQVVALRMGRMMAGSPSAADKRDFHRMGLEKGEAAAEMWNEMAAQMARSANSAAVTYAQAWWAAWVQLWFPWLAPGGRARFPLWGMTPNQLQHAAVDAWGKGLAPVRRRAVANAKRLGRKRRR